MPSEETGEMNFLDLVRAPLPPDCEQLPELECIVPLAGTLWPCESGQRHDLCHYPLTVPSTCRRSLSIVTGHAVTVFLRLLPIVGFCNLAGVYDTIERNMCLSARFFV